MYICDAAKIRGAYGLRGWFRFPSAASVYFGLSVVGGEVSDIYLAEYSYSTAEMDIFSARWFRVRAPGAERQIPNDVFR